DRGGGQLRQAPRRHRLAPDPGNDERGRGEAVARDVRPHPPLPHRQHRAGARAAAVVQRRVRGVPQERDAPHPQPRLPRTAPGSGGTDDLAGSRRTIRVLRVLRVLRVRGSPGSGFSALLQRPPSGGIRLAARCATISAFMLVELFGLLAVTSMVTTYALEGR